jgi:hypothetical protein
MVAFRFYLQSGKQRKVGWVEEDSPVVFGKKFPGVKGSMGRCAQPVLLVTDDIRAPR